MTELLSRLMACISHLDAAGLAKLAELLDQLDPFLRDATEAELQAGKMAGTDFRAHPPPKSAPMPEVPESWRKALAAEMMPSWMGPLTPPTPQDGTRFLQSIGMLPSSDMLRPGVRW